MRIVLFALTVTFCLNPLAAAVEPALPIAMSMEKEVGSGLEQQLPNILNSAIAMVQMFPPKGYENNLFQWSSDRTILSGKNLTLTFATSKTESIAPILTNSNASGMDAFTLAAMDPVKKTMSIILVLLVDKIFYDAQRNERPDGFARLILALAHEIYGNVQHFLEFDLSTAKPQTMADRVQQELSAHRASLLFLGGFASDHRYESIPENIRKDLLNLLPLEIKAYRSWQNSHPSAALDPACEAMLESFKGKR